MAVRLFLGVQFFGVRHHSPRSAAVLLRLLEESQPKCVLIEGPVDAAHLIPALASPDTLPPVAILGYRTDGELGSVFYPFAAYSPEYVALRWAHENDIECDFIDIPTSQAVSDRESPEADISEVRAPSPEEDFYRGLNERFQVRSFEEFWEAQFEAPDYETDTFRSAIVAYSDITRQFDSDVDYHRARDAFMHARIREKIEAGTDPASILVVAGAAHIAALSAGDVDLNLTERLPTSAATTVTLIPYSFTRLAEQTGYRAGVRAPRYYERAFERGCDFRAATLEMLIEFCGRLRLRGFAASMADTIEAFRLADMLARLRDKSAPGLDEVRDAAVATLCRGEARYIDEFLWSTVVGNAVGKVSAVVEKNSLQQEFWHEIKTRKLPARDEAEGFTLKLNDPIQIATSVFLHRLRIAEVPYANFSGANKTETVGGIGALARIRETWQAQWTPATEVVLAERIVLGDSFSRVCERKLQEKLGAAGKTSDAAHILLEAVVADIGVLIPGALSACAGFAAIDEDPTSLAEACAALSGLVSYGTSRQNIGTAASAIETLCVQTFARVALRIPEACLTNDDGLEAVRNAIVAIHEIAVTQSVVDKTLWFNTARRLIADYTIHPLCAGLITGLLCVTKELSETETIAVIGQRLTFLSSPAQAAGFLSGFMEINALILVRNPEIVGKLNVFMTGLSAEDFRNCLPMLRRGFSQLGATERRYLMENLLRAVKGKDSGQALAILKEKDAEKLKSVSKEIADIAKGLDDLL